MIFTPPFLGLVGPAASAALPPFYSDLVLWHDAQQEAGAENDAVAAWPDLASATVVNNGGTSGRLTLTGINGRRSIRFGNFGAFPANAGGAWYQYPSGCPLGGVTDFLVAFVAQYQTLASTGEQASTLLGRLSGGSGYLGYEYTTRIRGGIASAPYAASGPDLPAVYQTNRRFMFRRRGGVTTAVVDGVIYAMSGADAGTATWDALGNTYTTSYVRPFIGLMGEVLGYARDVTDAEVATIDNYLTAYWGL